MIDPRDHAEALYLELADRGLGNLPVESDLAEQDAADAWEEAATNLLDKAAHHLGDGDPGHADRLIARAVRLPFTESEGVHPALRSAHESLLCLITLAAEEDDEWLDAAADVLDSGSDGVRAAIVPALATLLADDDLSPGDDARLRAVLARFPGFRAEPELDGRSLDDEARATLVRHCLEAELRYSDRLASDQGDDGGPR